MPRRIARRHNPYDDGSPDPITSTFSAAAEASNVIAVTITLKDPRKRAMTGIVPVEIWLSDSATTGAIIGTAPDGGVALTTGSVLAAVVAGKYIKAISNASGVIVVAITHAAGAKTLYLYVKMPSGEVKVSSAVVFA